MPISACWHKSWWPDGASSGWLAAYLLPVKRTSVQRRWRVACMALAIQS